MACLPWAPCEGRQARRCHLCSTCGPQGVLNLPVPPSWTSGFKKCQAQISVVHESLGLLCFYYSLQHTEIAPGLHGIAGLGSNLRQFLRVREELVSWVLSGGAGHLILSLEECFCYSERHLLAAPAWGSWMDYCFYVYVTSGQASLPSSPSPICLQSQKLRLMPRPLPA